MVVLKSCVVVLESCVVILSVDGDEMFISLSVRVDELTTKRVFLAASVELMEMEKCSNAVLLMNHLRE